MRLKGTTQFILRQFCAAFDGSNEQTSILFKFVDRRIALPQLGKHLANDTPPSHQGEQAGTHHQMSTSHVTEPVIC